MKKILVLGGKPIGSCEITETAKKAGYYTIVTDYLKTEESAAKRIADESWEISTADVDMLKEECIKNNVSAVITGVHEFNIRRKIELCDLLKLPQYCTKEQWDFCEDKANFKSMCSKHGIDVAKTYTLQDDITYPVIVKPVDSSGSRGFSICHNREELEKGTELALSFSESKKYLIEEYMRTDACIIHYTAVNGEIYFSGMSDKISQCLEGGSSVMAFQSFPSESIDRYLDEVNEKAIRMFKDLGVQNGPIWIEAFNDKVNHRFIFNEMGYRFGGSLTNYPVQHFYGIDQMNLMVKNAVGEDAEFHYSKSFKPKTSHYCIMPIHIKAGVINKIIGLKDAENIDGVEHIVMVHYEGDIIKSWGTAQQVFCYLHISFNNYGELISSIDQVKKTLSAKNEHDEDMLFYLFDIDNLANK